MKNIDLTEFAGCTIEIDRNTLIAAILSKMTPDDIIQFIIDLDLAMDSEDFSLLLCEHFDTVRTELEAFAEQEDEDEDGDEDESDEDEDAEDAEDDASIENEETQALKDFETRLATTRSK